MSNPTNDLRFINEPESNFEYYFVIRIISVIQIFAEIFTIFHVAYVLKIFIEGKFCHIHFRILSTLFLIDLILKAIANVVVLVKFITGYTFLQTSSQYFYANLIQCTTNYIYYFYPLSIFVERTVPLIWAEKYEKYYSSSFVAVSIIAPIMGASYQTIHLFFLQTWFPILTVYMCTNTVMILIWSGYFVVYYFSKKFTNTNKFQRVSERYQRFENLRTHKTMNWFVIACILSLLLAFAYIHFLRQYKDWFQSVEISDINMIALCRIILDTAEAYLFLIIPIAFTFTHEKLKRKYLQIFSMFRIPSRISSTPATTEMHVIKSISGQNMIIKNEEEHYFSTLVSDWDAKFDKKDKFFFHPTKMKFFVVLIFAAMMIAFTAAQIGLPYGGANGQAGHGKRSVPENEENHCSLCPPGKGCVYSCMNGVCQTKCGV